MGLWASWNFPGVCVASLIQSHEPQTFPEGTSHFWMCFLASPPATGEGRVLTAGNSEPGLEAASSSKDESGTAQPAGLSQGWG